MLEGDLSMVTASGTQEPQLRRDWNGGLTSSRIIELNIARRAGLIALTCSQNYDLMSSYQSRDDNRGITGYGDL